MRIRTVLTLGTGAAIGAGTTYLLDPDHGERRRRDGRRAALRSARSGATHAVSQGRQRALEVASAAVSGYQQARTEPASEVRVAHLDDRRTG